MLVFATVNLLFDLQDVSFDELRKQIEYAMNAACVEIEMSDKREPQGTVLFEIKSIVNLG